MKILDATCGAREMWYQKNHPLVTYMDKRNGLFEYQYPNSPKRDKYNIKPDVISEWKDAPFSDNYFDVVLFDPPHIIQNSNKGGLPTKYTVLNPESWRNDLRIGIKKLFRILKPNGLFIFKWDECSKPIKDVLKLFPYKPAFGTKTGSNNYWIVFIKFKMEKELDV